LEFVNVDRVISMQKKLTLSINDDLIDFAHDFAEETNQSISHLFEEYLIELKSRKKEVLKNLIIKIF